MEFKDYGFKPADVIKGLNLYYSVNDPKYLHIEKGKHSYWHLLDRDVTEAINWLREEYNIFYTPGMKVEDANRPDDTKDIFDTPRYKFLSILSAELGFRTIVGPGNADKTEDAIMRAVKSRNDELKNFRAQQFDEESEAGARKEFLRKLRCELGVPAPVVKGNMEKLEEDILERIGELKEGNWRGDGNTFADYMRKRFPKECEKWHVRPLKEGSVHDWVQHIFGELDGWRNRALKDEEERDTIYEELGMNPADDDVREVVAAIKKLREDRAKYKGMLNTCHGVCVVENVLPCYRDTCNNPKAIKERDAANEALAELRAKIREVYSEVFKCGFSEDYQGYISPLDDILKEFRFQKKLKEKAEEKTIEYKGLAKENRLQWDNTKAQLQWAQKENLEWLKRYEKLKSELDEMTKRYGESVIASGGLCEDLAREREKARRMEQKLSEIQDICER